MTHLAPLPGDAHAVAANAREMIEAAEQMTRAAAELRQIASYGEYQSEAVDKFRQQADELATTMTRASTRYRGAGNALARYAPVLEQAQEDARQAISEANATDVGSARYQVGIHESEMLERAATNDAEGVRRSAELLSNAREELRAESARHASAVHAHEAAVQRVRAAAQTAIAEIRDAEETSELNDTFWDNLRGLKEHYLDPIVAQIKQHLVDVLRKAVEWLDVLSEVLTLTALVLFTLGALVALFPPAAGVAGVLIGAAALAKLFSTGASLISLSAQLGRYLLGDISYGELLGSALGAASIVIGVPKWAKTAGSALGRRLRVGRKVSKFVGTTAEPIVEGAYDTVVKPPMQGFVESALPEMNTGPMWSGLDSAVNTGLANLSSHDVSPMTADFSNLNTSQLVESAFSAETLGNRGMVCQVNGGGSW